MTYERLFEKLCDTDSRDDIISDIVNLPPVEAEPRLLLALYKRKRQIQQGKKKFWGDIDDIDIDSFWDALVYARYIFQDLLKEELLSILRENDIIHIRCFSFKIMDYQKILAKAFKEDMLGSYNPFEISTIKDLDPVEEFLEYTQRVVPILEKTKPRERELWKAIRGVYKLQEELGISTISGFCSTQSNHFPKMLLSPKGLVCCLDHIVNASYDGEHQEKCSTLKKNAKEISERLLKI